MAIREDPISQATLRAHWRRVVPDHHRRRAVRRNILYAATSSCPATPPQQPTAFCASQERCGAPGIAADIVMHLCDVRLMMMLYVLLKPVSKNLALLAMLFTLVQSSVLHHQQADLLLDALFLLGGNGSYLNGADPRQLQVIAHMFLE